MNITSSTLYRRSLPDMSGHSRHVPVKTLLLYGLMLLSCLASGVSHAVVLDIGHLQGQGKIQLLPFFAYAEIDRQFNIQNLPDYADWQAASTVSVDNYRDTEVWLKLSLHNSSDAAQSFVLVQSNAQIPYFTLWQDSKGSLEQLYSVGNHKKFAERPIQHRYFVLPLQLNANESRDFYIHSTFANRDLVYRSYLWSEDAFFKTTHAIDLWEIFYFGIVLVMLIYNLTIFFVTHEKSYLFYALFISGAFFTFTSTSGYSFQLLWPNWPWLNWPICLVGMAIMMSFAGWFSMAFLQLRQFHPRLSTVLHGLGFSILALAVVMLALPYESALVLMRIMVVMALPVYLLSWVAGIMTVREQKEMAYKVYLGAWTLLIFASLLTLVHEVVWPIFPISIITFMQIVHAIEVVLLSIALASRINSLRSSENLAKAKIDAQAKFLARMSHEIRTPMNGIVGMSDLLIKRISNETDKHYIEIIHSSAEALQQIINDILDYSKIEAGKLQLRQESFAIRDIVKDVKNLFELQCEQKELTMHINIDDAIPAYVSGDPHRIRQILINLVSNAVKYTFKGTITIHIAYFDKNILFSIKDTGEGISKNDQENLFKPFEQAANNNLGRESSTGLGLAISRELVSLMQGEIGVNSELGEGSTFWFTLYLPETEAPFKDNNADADIDFPLPVINIMVAEDNKVNKAVIKGMLRTLGMNFVVVGNGVEAVGYFKQAHEHIDMILMDCEMPAMDGFKASEIIRTFEKENYLLRTPIIALTAHTWHQELQHCYDSGMDELLLKPITRHAIESLLKRYITAVKRPRQKLAE